MTQSSSAADRQARPAPARCGARAGTSCVLDRATFPRDKVCAGWLTPSVFPSLELDPAEYRAAGLTLQEISSFRTGVLAANADGHGSPLIETRYPHVVSYAIRRCEFDDFLLRRAGVQVLEGHADDRAATRRRSLDRQRLNRGSGRRRRRGPLLPRGQAPARIARHVAARGGEGSGISRQRSKRRSRSAALPNCSSAATSRATGGACGRATTSTSASGGERAATSESTSRGSSRSSKREAR